MIKCNSPLNRLRALYFLFLSFLVSTFFSNIHAQVKYVKPVAAGTGDGSSWTNASSNLQAMIQASPAGGQVWVQAGTYYPSTKPYSGASPITTSDPRDVTFHIKDNVSLFGGFSGTETAINQRNITLNETILSGDLGVIGDSTDNAYHVVMLVQTAFAIQDGALDGFTIKGGNANGTGSVSTLLYPSLRNYGGGIYTSYASGTIKNCKITSCASTGGGAIYFSRSTINFDYCSVFGNRSASKGGGIYVSSDQTYSTLIVNHSDFFDNRSINEAGAFYMNYGSLTMDNCNFYNNLAGGLGSGFWGSYNILTIYNCQFYQNQGSAGALYLFQGIGTISSSSFYNNQGGGINLSNNLSGDMLLENNDFHNNTANNGAALTFNGGKTVIRRNLFYDNTAATRGGAIYFIPLSQPNSLTNNYSVVEQNIFMNNQTTHVATLNGGFGGAWFSQDGQHRMINNLYVSNSANRGGAIYGQGAKIHLENNTFYGNSANYDGGAMVLFSDTDTLINNVFSANTKGSLNLSSDVEQTQPGSTAAFYNNSLQSATIASYSFASANSGNFFQIDPLFVDENDFDGLDNLFFTEDDGLNLQKCSPLIDTGLVASAISTDIVGNVRIQQATIDLGAYESSYENTLPHSVILSGGGAYCVGSPGIIIDVDNPESGVVYHLLLNGIETGDTLALSGAPDFGYQTATGNYTVVAESVSSNCVWEMDTTLLISTYNLPLVEITVTPSVICEGQNVTLNPSGAVAYQWSNSSINSGVPFIPTNGATYVLTGTDANGCINTDTLNVTTLPLPDNGISVDVITLSAVLNGATYQWINCNSGQPLAGETNQVFTATQNGTYAVIVNHGNCSDTSDCIIIAQVGLETMDQTIFSISPNPASSNLTIHATETDGEFTLLDQQGRVLQRFQVEENMLIQLDNFAQGIYILRLQTDLGVFEKRFVKE